MVELYAMSGTKHLITNISLHTILLSERCVVLISGKGWDRGTVLQGGRDWHAEGTV